jgi:hypothetical protein
LNLQNKQTISIHLFRHIYDKYWRLRNFVAKFLKNNNKLDEKLLYTNKLSERCLFYDYTFIQNIYNQNDLIYAPPCNCIYNSFSRFHGADYLKKLNENLNYLEFNIDEYKNIIIDLTEDINLRENFLFYLLKLQSLYSFILVLILTLYINPEYKEDLFSLLNCSIYDNGQLPILLCNNYDKIPNIIVNQSHIASKFSENDFKIPRGKSYIIYNSSFFFDYINSCFFIILKISDIFKNKESNEYPMLLKIFKGIDFNLLEIIIKKLANINFIIQEINKLC